MTTSAPPFAARPDTELPTRLAALASLVQIAADRSGPGGFSPELLAEAQELLERAGERLKLSAAHTVVTLAGGTGSGKSSLFNALAGATFSPPAVTRPATRHAHACVWGMQGAAPLLDWLGIERRYRYARASALDAGEAALSGLLLLDLPDHDSVVAGAGTAVDRLISQADLMVWVLDPQKYADAAVHNRFLAPLARQATVTTVALNQCDLLTAQQAKDCEEDLRRLLDSEGHGDARVLLVSAATGAGLDKLRQTLGEAVSARRMAADRIAADIDSIIAKFAAYATDPAAVARRAADVGPALAGAAAPPAAGGTASSPSATSAGAGELDVFAAEPARPGPADDQPPWDETSLTGTPAAEAPSRPVRSALESVPAGPALNLADGKRSVAEIRDVLSGRYAAVDIAAVTAYFDRLAKAGGVTWK